MAATPRDIIDMAARDLARQAPLGFFGLAGLPIPDSPIRSGDFSVIIPELQADKLLVVTAEEPTEATLREVKALLDGVEERGERRDNLYGLAAMLGLHFCEEALVRAVFGPKFEEIKKMGVIDRWLDEKYQEGMDQGMSQGITQGIDEGARQVVLELLREKFGEAPATVVERVQHADAEWCRRISRSIARARTLEELNFS